MPNHVHVIVEPSDEVGLRRTFADAHRRYTGFMRANAGPGICGKVGSGRW
jgi:putative transposase